MKKTSDKKRILRNSIIVTSTTIIEKITFIAINISVARYLSVSDYGEYTTALGYATFFSFFCGLGIYQSIIRMINLDPLNERQHFGNSVLIRGFLTIIIYAVLAGSLVFTNYNTNTIHLILIFGLVRFGNQLLIGFYSLYDAKEKFITTSLYYICFSLSFLTITFIIIYLGGNYFHFAFSRLAVVCLFLVSISITTYINFRFTIDLSSLKHLLKNTIPFALHIVYNNIILRVNIIILSLIHGTIYSGIFNNGYIFLTSLTFIPQNIQRVLVPYLYKEKFIDNNDKFQFSFNIFSKFFNIISFYIFIILFIFSREIILFIFGQKYEGTVIILKILAFAIPFLFNAATIIITSLDRQEYNTRISAYAAVFNVTLNITLIYFFKAEGAALAAVFTFMFIYTCSHAILKKKGFIRLFKSTANFVKLIFSVFLCCLAFRYFLYDLHFMVSFLCTSILYGILTLVFIINKNDLRIIREIITR